MSSTTRTLTLTPDESVVVRRHDPDVIEVEVTYAAGAAMPPLHFHPAQDERFEVLAGAIRVRRGDEEQVVRSGEAIDIPRGTSHQISADGDEGARAIWETRPAGRTLEWFEALDAAARSGDVGADHKAGPLLMGVLMTEYRDVIRLSARPRWLVTALLALLGAIGRLAGRAPQRVVAAPAG